MNRFRRILLLGLAALANGASAESLDAQDSIQAANPQSKENADEALRRLAAMTEIAAANTLFLGSDRKTKLTLHPEPLLRWSNPVSGVKDGLLLMWTADGRPQALDQPFLTRRGEWVHECSSLAVGPLLAEDKGRMWWHTSTPGIEMKLVPRASAPAGTAAQRLREMRAIAQGFSASSVFGDPPSRYELRLLPSPLYRYGSSESELLDGALFAFVQGTNPEVILLIEAHSRQGRPEWQYGIAPMTVYAAEATRDESVVWSVPRRLPPPHEPQGTFFVRKFVPAPNGELIEVRP